MEKIIPGNSSNIFVIALERMDGELKIPEGGFSSKVALEKLKMILKCYGELYKRGMTHRDLKPKNFLVKKEGEKEEILKISDFGGAVEITDKKQNSHIFSFEYSSPQQIRNR